MATDTRTRDTVTSLLNYDVSDNDNDDDDPFREIDTTIHEPTGTKRKAISSDNKENPDALGIDEEVKISKKRKPIAKLDEARLLSQLGIPKLRALARSKSIASKLRLKGKGHEYSDAAKLLGYYQLWLDDLYPRAKFVDGLQLVEKVGHGKRMQVMRREWIDEGKPGYGDDVEGSRTRENVGKGNGKDGSGDGSRKESAENKSGEKSKHNAHGSIFGGLSEGQDNDLFFNDQKGGTGERDDSVHEPDEDELDALLAEQAAPADFQRRQHQRVFEDDEEDDLDAIMAEKHVGTSQGIPSQQKQKSASPREDDLDPALADSAVVHRDSSEKTQPECSTTAGDEDEDELEALLAEQAAAHPEQPSTHG